uniref:MADF domain-containing protein n=1 Tax=Anopheles epiroticus TaxID=199890 RepID=A0A182P4Z3_9DIPT
MGPTKISPEDQSFNIMFVSEVKKHPCLFDSSDPDYKQQVLQDRAWQDVSDAVGEGMDTCKKRWRNLRCCMTRYQKSVRDNPDQARRKPYYLYSHMQFVLPYLKAREETNTFEQDETTWPKSETLSKNEEEDDDEEEEPHEIETIDVSEEEHSEQIKDSILQSIKIMPIGQETTTAGDQQQLQPQHDVLRVDHSSATTTTTTPFEIITVPPLKQARISHTQTNVGSISPGSSTTLQSGDSDAKRDILTQRQFFTITNTAMQPTSIPMSCYTTTPMAAAATSLHHQQPSQPQQTISQQQLQAQVPPQFTFIPNAPPMVNDADHNFFQSLVPDIQTMTMVQKRKLKIGILQLIDGILSS